MQVLKFSCSFLASRRLWCCCSAELDSPGQDGWVFSSYWQMLILGQIWQSLFGIFFFWPEDLEHVSNSVYRVSMKLLSLQKLCQSRRAISFSLSDHALQPHQLEGMCVMCLSLCVSVISIVCVCFQWMLCFWDTSQQLLSKWVELTWGWTDRKSQRLWTGCLIMSLRKSQVTWRLLSRCAT